MHSAYDFSSHNSKGKACLRWYDFSKRNWVSKIVSHTRVTINYIQDIPVIFRHVFASQISTGGLINVELSENKSIKNELCRNDLHLTNFLSNFQKCSKSENNISVPWTKKSVGSKYAVEVAGVSNY